MAKSNEKDPDLMKVTYYFSGYVKSTSYESIVDAMVEVNTGEFNSDKILKRTTTTDKKGYFKIGIPSNARKPRFVLNIWKECYGLLSQIFFMGKQNGIWLLTKGTIHTIDPKKDKTIRDTPHITKFTGPLTRHIDISKITSRRLLRADKIAAIKKLLQSTQRNLDPQVIKGIQNKGIQVTIKTDTLEDSDEQPPVGPVNVTLATVDILGPDSMPGDFTAVFKDEEGNDQIGYMITYGAGSVDVSANGKKYQLKPGSKAKIEIPLPKHLEGSKFIPKTIPFLEYNKEKGIWEKIGEGIFNENTQVYTATTTKFSSFNMDILKNDQACLVIDGTGIKKDYKLQVDFDYNGNTTPRYAYPNANEIYALYNLAPDIDYTLTAFKTELTDPPIVIDCKTCRTTDLQYPLSPNIPDSGCNFIFLACKCNPNPVILSAAPPLPPSSLNVERIECNNIDLSWVGNANGPEEGYIIKVYENVGDPPLIEYTASYEDTTLRVEGLEPYTIYYFHIHQYDEYAEEDSGPCPSSPPDVRTSASQSFSIKNAICGQQITQVYFNSGTDNKLPPGEVINYGLQHGFTVCRIPHRIQVETGIYSYDFKNNSKDSIYVGSLVKFLPGHEWYTLDIPPLATRTLVFDEFDGSFKFYDENMDVIDCGTYQETDQDCGPGIISFSMSFNNLGEVPSPGGSCNYYSSTNTIIITDFPSSPRSDPEFKYDII